MCEYCNDTGEIETDNNGPIGPCPMCKSADPALLPCPFCGGTPNVAETEGCDFLVACNACDITMCDDMDWGKDGYDGKKNVIDKWNRRAGINAILTCTACAYHGPQEDCEVCGGEVTYMEKIGAR